MGTREGSFGTRHTRVPSLSHYTATPDAAAVIGVTPSAFDRDRLLDELATAGRQGRLRVARGRGTTRVTAISRCRSQRAQGTIGRVPVIPRRAPIRAGPSRWQRPRRRGAKRSSRPARRTAPRRDAHGSSRRGEFAAVGHPRRTGICRRIDALERDAGARLDSPAELVPRVRERPGKLLEIGTQLVPTRNCAAGRRTRRRGAAAGAHPQDRRDRARRRNRPPRSASRSPPVFTLLERGRTLSASTTHRERGWPHN
jgi:hypothetical protein